MIADINAVELETQVRPQLDELFAKVRQQPTVPTSDVEQPDGRTVLPAGQLGIDHSEQVHVGDAHRFHAGRLLLAAPRGSAKCGIGTMKRRSYPLQGLG